MIGHADENLFREGKLRAGDKDGGGLALLGGREVGFFLRQREITRAGAVGGREPRHHDRTVSKNRTLELFGNLGCGKRHIGMGGIGIALARALRPSLV